MIEEKRAKDSRILFAFASSNKFWSYSLIATMKMMAVTPSKQFFHFFRSDLCPPTSNILDSEENICQWKLPVTKSTNFEKNLGDASCLDTTPKDVLI